MPEDNDVNAGAELDNQPGADAGAGDGSDNEGNPGQPNGSQPAEDWKTKYDDVQRQNVALNKLLVEARRQANSGKNSYKPGQANGQGNGENNQPLEQDFGTAMKLAESDIRSELDGILDLYPELPANLRRQIISNPWGFSSRASFTNLNVPNALLDIETWVSNWVAENADGTPSTQVPQAPSKVPANPVRPNAAPAGGDVEEDIVPGSDQDKNPWTMPLDKLGRQIDRKFRKK